MLIDTNLKAKLTNVEQQIEVLDAAIAEARSTLVDATGNDLSFAEASEHLDELDAKRRALQTAREGLQTKLTKEQFDDLLRRRRDLKRRYDAAIRIQDDRVVAVENARRVLEAAERECRESVERAHDLGLSLRALDSQIASGG